MKNKLFLNFLIFLFSFFNVVALSLSSEKVVKYKDLIEEYIDDTEPKELIKFVNFKTDFDKKYSHLDLPLMLPGGIDEFSQSLIESMGRPYDCESLSNYYKNYDIKSWSKHPLLVYNPFIELSDLKALFICNEKLEMYKAIQEQYRYRAQVEHFPVIVINSYNDFITLHECGHYALSKHLPINADADIQSAAFISSYALLTKLKKCSFKNSFTRLISKSFLSLFTSYAAIFVRKQVHERYADNFACNHIADKKAIEEAIENLKKSQASDDQYLKQTFWGKNKVLRSLYELYDNPSHPSTTSRIKKLERTIKKRFPN